MAVSRIVRWATMFWLPERKHSAHADQEIQERYATAIALWDASHNRDRRGLLPEQRERWLQYIAATHGELRYERAAFWRWLVKKGRVKL
jgi:hypothetical protein